MSQDRLLILRGEEIAALLGGREREVIDQVAAAYVLHGEGQSSLPHSLFLRFPEAPANRIIALPAYLGGDVQLAGMKWIASFPANIEQGIDRASALIALNSAETGRPTAVMEASVISAKRTAASAALAAEKLMAGRRVERAALVGCGLIQFEIVRFLRAVFPDLKQLTVFDLSDERARQFKDHAERVFGDVEVTPVGSTAELLGSAPLVSFATTAGTPHVDDVSALEEGGVILHVSLRDLSPEVILTCDNLVDDLDHVARAQTSIHLAELETGGREFVRATLADVLSGRAPARIDDRRRVCFSPFGLGVLDLAVASWVFERANAEGTGTALDGFLPRPWTERD